MLSNKKYFLLLPAFVLSLPKEAMSLLLICEAKMLLRKVELSSGIVCS